MIIFNDRKKYIDAIKKSIKNTSIQSAVMTAASMYYNKKIQDIWYFSGPTNNTKLVIVQDGGVTSESNVTSESVLPGAYFIEMNISYGGTAVSAPIEEGSYTTYNKTNEPYKINATLAFDENKGKQILNKKNVPSLQDTLDKLITLKRSPITFNIITPTKEYENVTLESFTYQLVRENGLGVLFVAAVFVEVPTIKVKDKATTDVKSVDGINKKSGGTKELKGIDKALKNAETAVKETWLRIRNTVTDRFKSKKAA